METGGGSELRPARESTHAVTSRGSDKLVVPEEKMADHEEQLSDEEKVRRRFKRQIKLQRGGGRLSDFESRWGECVGASRRRRDGSLTAPSGRGLDTTAAASALIIFSSTSAPVRLSKRRLLVRS